MKTPGLVHQLIYIQCPVNTDHKQKPSYPLNYIEVYWYYIKINWTFFNTITEATKGTWSVQC